MANRRALSIDQKQTMMKLLHQGKTYDAIREAMDISYWTVRKWARRLRNGDERQLSSPMGRPKQGALAAAPPLVRYLALRLKRQHPGWGQDYVVQQMGKHPGLQGVKLPSPTAVWRYWRSFGDRVLKAHPRRPPQPPPVTVVHGLWQLDFKESVDIAGLGPTTITHARDTVGRATVLHRIHPATEPAQRIVKPTMRQVQADCRVAFRQWGLPDAIQTDHASLFVDDGETPFPKLLVLWWLGLGITHRLLIRSPKENGSVERSHRTMVERTLSGRSFSDAAHFQQQLDQDWQELNTECPSQARGCQGRPPLVAFPDLAWPRRHYFPEEEARLFSLACVDTYLAERHWIRQVNSHGRLSLGGELYGVGRAWAGQPVSIRFCPTQRTFSFSLLATLNDPNALILRRPALGLSAADIMGPVLVPHDRQPKQLHFPLLMFSPPASSPQA